MIILDKSSAKTCIYKIFFVILRRKMYAKTKW